MIKPAWLLTVIFLKIYQIFSKKVAKPKSNPARDKQNKIIKINNKTFLVFLFIKIKDRAMDRKVGKKTDRLVKYCK